MRYCIGQRVHVHNVGEFTVKGVKFESEPVIDSDLETDRLYSWKEPAWSYLLVDDNNHFLGWCSEEIIAEPAKRTRLNVRWDRRLTGNPFVLLEAALVYLGDKTSADAVWVEESGGKVELRRCDVDAAPDATTKATTNTILSFDLPAGIIEDDLDYERWVVNEKFFIDSRNPLHQLAIAVLTGDHEAARGLVDIVKETL